MDKRKTEVYVAGRKVERIYCLCNILHYTKFPKLTQRFKPYADLSSHEGLSGGIPGGSSSSQLSARAQRDRREHSGSIHVPSEPQTAHKSRAGYLWLKHARRKSRLDLCEANEPSVPPLQVLVQGYVWPDASSGETVALHFTSLQNDDERFKSIANL